MREKNVSKVLETSMQIRPLFGEIMFSDLKYSFLIILA